MLSLALYEELEDWVEEMESWLPILLSLVVLESIPLAVDDPDELADWAKDVEDVSYVAILLASLAIAELVPKTVEIWGFKKYRDTLDC